MRVNKVIIGALLSATTLGLFAFGIRALSRHPVAPATVSSSTSREPMRTDRSDAPYADVPAQPAHAEFIDGKRLLVAATRGGDGKTIARIPELDEILREDESNEAWTRDVLDRARTAIPAEAGLKELSVNCAQTFCRVTMVKPLTSPIAWHQIDDALAKVAQGETVFSTESSGDYSTGYLYFSDLESVLPLGNPNTGSGLTPNDVDGV